jgi:hypothetical protein
MLFLIQENLQAMRKSIYLALFLTPDRDSDNIVTSLPEKTRHGRFWVLMLKKNKLKTANTFLKKQD